MVSRLVVSSAILVRAVVSAGALLAILSAAAAQSANGVYGGPPPANWTGAYAGAHGGVGIAHVRGRDASGGLIGGQIGFNAQADRVVLGVEGDVTSSGFERKGFNGGGQTFKQKWVGTVRGRVGYAFDRVLVYGTAGVAAAENEMRDFTGKANERTVGYAAGAGLEVQVTDRISARGEYLHYGLGTGTYSTGLTTYKADSRSNVARVGLNYRF
jgi:outer membrane immunogenic protein